MAIQLGLVKNQKLQVYETLSRLFPPLTTQKHRKSLILLILMMMMMGVSLFAENRVLASLVTRKSTPTAPIQIGVQLTVPKGWHIYGPSPGDVGLPTTVKWAPSSVSVTPLPWPKATPFTLGPITSYGYSGSVSLPYRLESNPTQPFTLNATAEWIVCKEECIPESVQLSINIDPKLVAVVADPINTPPNHSGLFPWMAIISAFIGGLLLNLMPCVFPVLSLKILSLAKLSGGSRTELRKNGVIFSSGILVSVWALAIIILLLRRGSSALGWGFQLQSPIVVVGLILIFTAMATNLLGAFEMGASLTRVQGMKTTGKFATFLNGGLVTVVATPCTAPFMGVALGVALTQSAVISLVIFTSLGIGLASPYLILSAFPELIQRLPKPGKWMETLKQGLAFPLLGSALWLSWVISNQLGAGGALIALLGALGLSGLLWAYGKLLIRQHPLRWVMVVAVIGISIATLWRIHAFSTARPVVWERYSKEAVSIARQTGAPIFIDFSADWCLTCQFNERTVLSSDAVQAAFDAHHVRRFKADWTAKDTAITQALAELGRSGVPAYVIYINGSPPLLLSELLTESEVIQSISRH